jgi:outer membrane protein TolC
MRHGSLTIATLVLSLSGCAGLRDAIARRTPEREPVAQAPEPGNLPPVVSEAPEPEAEPSSEILPVAAEEPANPAAPQVLALDAVVSSVYANFPLLEVARYQRNIANAEILAANGNFDTKLKGSTENGPVGFYQTYRQTIGVTQPLYGGADVFGGYRIGRGEFQPWYQERQTNGNGEFKGGVQVPLARNRSIDARRAELWKSTYARQRTEPEIQIQLIEFVRDGSIQYWEWVAASKKEDIASQLLVLATGRNEGIRKRVKAGDLDPPDADDNQRIIVSRQAKLIDATRKSRQSAVKLSLYYRDDMGQPIIPLETWVPEFPEPPELTETQLQSDIQTALAMRPELRALDLLRREIDIDYASAQNDFLPQVDALVTGSQDNGTPTSSKKDKSPFELEAGIYAEVPIQRRKARGKMSALEAKASQIVAKRRMTEDKITTEVQATFAALTAARERVVQAREAVRLAKYMAEVEQKKFDNGSSDLLSVNLREQQAAEAAETEVDALLEYFQAQAVYRAALARDNDDGYLCP